MNDNRTGKLIVYGAAWILAMAAALIWPESHLPYIAAGMFGLRTIDALWPKMARG